MGFDVLAFLQEHTAHSEMPLIVAILSENFAIHLEDHEFYLNKYIFKCKYSLFSQSKMWLQLILRQYREPTLFQVAQKYILA